MTLSTHAPRPHAVPNRGHEDHRFPLVMMRAMLGLVLTALVLTTLFVLSDRPLTATPPVADVVETRVLYLQANGLSGAVTVLDQNRDIVADLAPEKGGFIAGVARVIAHERGKRDADPSAPIHVQRQANGRVAIIDPETGWRADLMGFGADNARAFAKLLAP
jgi:putative photosynthetic complex assembly protein